MGPELSGRRGSHYPLVMVCGVTIDQCIVTRSYTAMLSRMCEKLPLGGFRGVIMVKVIGYCLSKLKKCIWWRDWHLSLPPPPLSLLRLWGVCTSSLPCTLYRQCTVELHKCIFCKYSDPAQEAMLYCNYKTCRLTGYYDSEVHKRQIHSTDLSCKSSFPK